MFPFPPHISKSLRPKFILQLYLLVHSSCLVTLAFSVSSLDVLICIHLICKPKILLETHELQHSNTYIPNSSQR